MTFLLTDVEGSTRLWSRCPDAMRDAVVETYAILHHAINDHDGVLPVEQGEGDSVVGAFPRASGAVKAALQAQLEIRAHEWPVGLQLRVRMALHTAEAQLRDERNYFGVALSRCARLRALARGGQTLLSRATRDLVADGLPPGARLVDCRVVALRDLERPEHVFALDHPALDDGAAQFVPVATPGVSLPDPLTPFVGRERELRQLRDALTETRLLTLTGAGGVGKTRLAAQAAAGARGRFAGGAWWIGLASVTDGELVDEALADALGVRALPARTALDAACARLVDSRALVVLDNCEHVGEACADMTQRLLRACPAVVVMATSRMPLGVAGETDWRVPSMSLPAAHNGPPSLDDLDASDAVRLFAERARRARPGFAVGEQNAAAVIRICRELDGLPLAIELAAARLRMMSVEQVASALADRLRLLTGGTRGALPRQRTLRASVDWSHDLLSDSERVLLRRLAVFAGGFTLELAENACAESSLARAAILELLGSLVDQSLVVAEERDGLVRYRLLETVRQYALERLVEAGEDAAMADRHRDAMIELAERIAPRLHSPGQRDALGLLDREAANLAAAIDHAADTDPHGALRLVVAMTFWWKLQGLFEPARRAFANALAADTRAGFAARARAHFGRGYLAVFAGRSGEGLADLEQARLTAEAVGDESALARALTVIGFTQMFADPVGSRATSERARELARGCADGWAFVVSTINLAHSYVFRQEFDEAEHRSTRSTR